MDGVDKFLRRYPDAPVIEDVLGTLAAARPLGRRGVATVEEWLEPFAVALL